METPALSKALLTSKYAHIFISLIVDGSLFIPLPDTKEVNCIRTAIKKCSLLRYWQEKNGITYITRVDKKRGRLYILKKHYSAVGLSEDIKRKEERYAHALAYVLEFVKEGI